MAIEKFWHNNQCALTYKTDIDEYNEYWYNDTKNMIGKYQFVVIHSLLVPMEVGNKEVIEFIKEFCRLMTIENRVVIYDNEEFIKYLEDKGSTAYYDACTNVLEEILCKAGFDVIMSFDHSYFYKDVFIYTKSNLGLEAYNTVENYFHEEFYDD